MGKIVLLDELTINQIAAGEVIERPASVVKEMIENSIDAGANNITVEIKNGGISYIRIADNGKGIARDDVELAFERHATSKIRSAADLVQVKSMGFRGEALASIAAIANVELVSKTEEEQMGTKIIVEGGNILSTEYTGSSTGTTITVRNLFYNTPVRYKFLKKDFTETGYIEDVITRVALVHPEVAIKLINTGKTVIQTNGNGDLKSVIYSIYGKDVAENIIPVEFEHEYIKIKGVISNPEIARSNRAGQIFFVNKRYVKDKTLISAAEQAYKGITAPGKFAFLVLDLEMDPSKVDVNVHPAKLEVRFSEENTVFQATYNAIKNTLQSKNLASAKETKEEIKEAQKDAFKIDYNALNAKRSETSSSTELSVFDRLKKLQEDLQNQINSIPKEHKSNVQQTAEQPIYKMEETILKTEEKPTEEQKIEEKQIEEQLNEKINEIKEVVEEKHDETNTIQIEEKIEEIEDKPVVEVEEQGDKENINKENDNEEENKKIEENSFEEMYKKLFGKEPYGGRLKVEEKKEDPYKITEGDLKDNISVFEGMEDYEKPKYKYIGIAFNSYIVLEMNQELYILDQHAAHERIIYDKLKKNFESSEDRGSQMLLLPDVVTLTNKEMAVAKENFAMFERAGFMLEEFGENTIKVSGVPEICIELDTKELFMETLDEIDTVARTARQEKEEKFIATLASKVAVNANMALEEVEAINLIEELLKLPNPFYCPNGRSTVIKMSRYDIERKFARK